MQLARVYNTAFGPVPLGEWISKVPMTKAERPDRRTRIGKSAILFFEKIDSEAQRVWDQGGDMASCDIGLVGPGSSHAGRGVSD